jgi:L-threonylcarbamoyladenylate synthase
MLFVGASILRFCSSNSSNIIVLVVNSFQPPLLAARTTRTGTTRNIVSTTPRRNLHRQQHRGPFFLTSQDNSVSNNKFTTITRLPSLSALKAASTSSSASASTTIPVNSTTIMTAADTHFGTKNNGGSHHTAAPSCSAKPQKETRAKRVSFFQSYIVNSNNNKDTKTTARDAAISKSILQACGERIRNGDLVAFPTETVYGLGCNALNAAACKKVFLAKERPLTDPLIAHVNHAYEAYPLWHATSSRQQQYGDTTNHDAADIIQQHCLLLERRILESLCLEFWPGPLTLVARAATAGAAGSKNDSDSDKNGIPVVVTIPPPSILMAGTGFVACRSPRHPIARRLIQAARVPIAAPSANKFGHVSPTTAQHVWDDLQYENVWIVEDDDRDNDDDDDTSGGAESVTTRRQPQEIDKGKCDIGVESTVAKLEVEVTTTTNPGSSSSLSTPTAHLTATLRVLRQGAVSAQELDACLQQALSDGRLNRPTDDGDKNSNHNYPDGNDHDDSSPFPLIQLRVLTQHKNATVDDHVATVAPGQTIRHYSPLIPSFVLSHECIQQASALSNGNDNILQLQQAVVVDFGQAMVQWKNVALAYRDLSDVGDSAQAARCVFETLRWAEQVANAKRIFFPSLTSKTTTMKMEAAADANAETIPDNNNQQDDALLLAVEDRLTRAASGVVLERLEDANV